MRGVSRASLADLVDALSAVAGRSGTAGLGDVARELLSFVHLLDDEPRLRRVLADPGVVGSRRSALASDLLEGNVSGPALELATKAVGSQWARPADLVDAVDEVAADALFTAAEEQGKLDDVEDELFRFGRILDREPQLRAALTDPALPPQRKQELLVALVGGRVHDATRTLVEEVVLHPRGRTIDRGLEEYGRLAAERRARLVATVRTVVPLTEQQADRLAAGLETRLGHPVRLNIEIDPDLVGGISVRVGDELFDGSVAQRVAEVHRRMAG